jgi:glycerate kinase
MGDALRGADLVITGEGSIDVQTARGKAPEAIARLAKSGGRAPLVVALAGRIEGASHGAIDASYCIHPGPRSLADAMNPEVTLAELAATAERVVRNFVAGTVE